MGYVKRKMRAWRARRNSRHLHSHGGHIGKTSTSAEDWVRGLRQTPLSFPTSSWFTVWVMPDREMGSGDLTASCGRQFVLPYRGGRPLGGVQELPVGHFAQRTREDDEHLLFDLLTDLYAQGYRPLHEEEESRRSPRVKARAFFNALLREAESRPVVVPFGRDDDEPPDYFIIATRG